MAIILLHWPLLHLPYLWDESYFVTIARDVMSSGDSIPSSVPSNGHPPLVFGYLALAWKVFGFQPLVTRVAMLAWAAFGLVELFRLTRTLAGTPSAAVCVACAALYPVYFAQGSMAHLDLPAAALTFAGVRHYLDRRLGWAAVLFSIACLAKETAILAPAALLLLAISREWHPRKTENRPGRAFMLFAFPLAVIVAWYCYHWLRTGYVFGNPLYFNENVTATLNPLRLLVALVMRMWHLLGHMNLWALTMPLLVLGWNQRVTDDRLRDFGRVVFSLAFVFGIGLSVIGGALLARYLLPIVPLIICLDRKSVV